MKETDQKQTSLPWFGLPKLAPFLKPYVRLVVGIAGLGLLRSVVDVVLPLFQKYAINHFIGGNTIDGLVWFCIAFLAVLAVRYTISYVAIRVGNAIEIGTGRDMRKKIFEHLQTLSFSYYNQNSVGYIFARVMSDTARIVNIVSWYLYDGVGTFIYFIGIIVVMFSMNARLALAVCSIIPVAVLVVVLFRKKLVVLNRHIREINSRISGDYNEGIVGAKTIKTLVAEDRIADDFRKDTDAIRHASVRTGGIRAVFSSLISLLSFTALAVVLWRGGMISINGLMEIGTLSVFMSYTLGLIGPIEWFASVYTDLIGTQVNIERMDRLLNTKSDVVDSPEVLAKYGDMFEAKRENWEPIRGDVEFRDVSFKYPDGDEFVLEHFNLKVHAGQSVAIVGETGAGKTTLVNLVCRFYEPTSGQVLIDGKDVRERSQLWLHSSIGYVLQSPHLFSGTVLENIKYGNPDAADDEIEMALKLVCADQVVAKLKNGLLSQIGEGGDTLSTGEKQLLSFARAILADPRILILDEATSSIDTVTEKIIQEAINKVTAGRTSFIIAHRLSTVVDANVILVVKAGKIIERGTHASLMRRRGYYYDLFTRQFAEESVDAVL